MSTVEFLRKRRREIFVTGKGDPLSERLMVHGLARLGAAALTAAEFALVLVVLVVLAATTIPALVRVPKR